MLSQNEFIEKNDEECRGKFNLDAKYIYQTYYNKINLYKHLITKFQHKDAVTIPELLVVFGVSLNIFNACRYYFKDLDNLINHKKDVMKLKSEMDLAIGIQNAPSNPKLLEMQFMMYNDEYKPKGSTVEVNMPTELKVSFDDMSANDNDKKD